MVNCILDSNFYLWNFVVLAMAGKIIDSNFMYF